MVVDVVCLIILGIVATGVIITILMDLMNGGGFTALDILITVSGGLSAFLVIKGEVLGAVFFGTIAISTIITMCNFVRKL